ncbi:hypothetical protein LX99_04221 [Mucilaginibacter oryzae]|uniref:SMEK domain-containing protein n=1 Tax=Mucilaginibacter oryzae TaxID=468058 RepID=A0A316H2C2_9SPHI|nr:ATP-binding protein [Mucilaginibacter oryzae]PWK72891.1 hypothetical protein LX99_04221 [Mucilaginibacter oryzae]
MPNKEKDLKDIYRLLGSWITEIRLEKAVKYLDINKVSEGFAMKLLNLIYDYNLVDLNDIKEDFPGLDLGELDQSKIAFQVTSRTDTAKVISSLKTVIAEKHHETFSGGIKFLILAEGEKIKFPKTSDPTIYLQSFDTSSDILYPEDLSKAIEGIYDKDDFAKFLKIKTLVERELQFITTVRPEFVAELISESEGRIQETIAKQFADLSGVTAANQQQFSYGSIELAEFPSMELPGQRVALVKAYIDNFTKKPILWLTGMSGSGKSSLAYLVGQAFSGVKLWVDLRDVLVTELPNTVIEPLSNSVHALNGVIPKDLENLMVAVGKSAVIVLNDLPDLAANDKSVRFLTGFVSTAIKHGIAVILTSNFQPPLNFKSRFSRHLVVDQIPLFTEQDTSEVLKFMNIPDEVLESHVKTVQVLSEGYPVVVNSIADYLKDNEWATDEAVINRIFKNDYNDQLNHEIYSKIISSTEDEATLELLYRCQLIIGTFGSKEVEALGNVGPAINHFRQKFERLKGVWIQTSQPGKFQLSPLIRRLETNVSQETAKAVNISLAKLLIKKGTLDQFDVSKAFHYFVNAGVYTDASFLLISILRESMKKPSLFFEWGFTLHWFYSPIPVEVNVTTRIFIRFLQVNICMAAKEPYDFLLDDIKQILATEEVSERVVGMTHMSFFQALVNSEPLDAMRHLVLAIQNVPLKELFADAQGELDQKELQNAIWLPFSNCRTRADFESWFDEVDKLYLSSFPVDIEDNHAYVAAGLSLYFNLIGGRQIAQVNELQQLLFYILDRSVKSGLGLITAYCLRNLVVIIGEDLNRMNQTEELVGIYHSFINSDPVYKVLVYDELGRQFFAAGNKEKAIFYLEQVVELKLSEFFTEQVVSFRVYAQLVGDENPSLALRFTQRALDSILSNSFFPPIEIVRNYGEVAIAKWLAGDINGSVASFETGYDLLNKIFDDSPEHRAQVVRFGSSANYVAQILTKGVAPTESEFGAYSVPKRGSFYFLDDKIHESGIYNPERRFMSANMFQVTYQTLGDYDTARKWALICIQIMLDVEEPRFAILLHCSLVYLIIDRDYGKALNVFNYIRQHYRPQSIKPGESGFDEEVRKTSERINNNDGLFYDYLFAPIIIRVIPDIMEGKIAIDEIDQLTADLFDNPALSITDPITLNFIREIFAVAMKGRFDVWDFHQRMNSYEGDYMVEVQMISYLLVSLHASAKEAANLHLSIVNRMESHYAGIFSQIWDLIIAPFFERFWRIKADQHQSEFYDFGIWATESVPRFSQESGKKRAKVLFKTLVYHLDLEPPANVTKWIRSR